MSRVNPKLEVTTSIKSGDCPGWELHQMNDQWHRTACILCSLNCGIEVKLDGRRITRVRGNREHVASQGYVCEKAQRIDFYQNGRDRLSAPLRRRPDGTFEEVDWDTAIREVAAGFLRVRDQWGGASIFYYGGGGQGNHLVGGSATALDAR
jgi:anaerobic selenocysteine-containing dehydrogenase